MEIFHSVEPLATVLSFAARIPDAVWAILVSAAATLVLLKTFAPRRTIADPAYGAIGQAPCDFVIEDRRLRAVNEPARMLLATIGRAGSPLAALTDHLAAEDPGLRGHLEGLIDEGRAFRHYSARRDGTAVDIHGAPRGGSVFLSIRAASEEARALKAAQDTLDRASTEIRFLRDILDRAPVLAWCVGPEGPVTWANAAYRARFDTSTENLPDHRIANAFGHVLEEVPLTAKAGDRRRRVSIPDGQNADPHWYELSQSPGSDGTVLGFALDADDLVAAEGSLRRFVETLTETFAHLPIGLAVFDKNRRLGLFNPALTDLVKIDAVWLAGRPSLRDFLERLRETRQMPEQKDFASFRRKLTELEEGARDGTYEENWVLPSGKVFRVSGRPHPQGALAFLFEDISTAISLERRYRSELELSQATLDRMSEAVAVFDTTGMLVFVNTAFERLWDLEPMERLSGPGVVDLTRIWQERCAPSALWPRLRAFATGAETRTSWTATVETLDGRRLDVLVAPLPDASALVVFRDTTAEATAQTPRIDPPQQDARAALDPTLVSLALEQIHVPAEAAMRQMKAAIAAAPTPEAYHALTVAIQVLQEGLSRSRELEALALGRPASMETLEGEATALEPSATEAPIPGLAPALAARGLTLAFEPGAPLDDPTLRRAIWAAMLAAADLAAPGAAISLKVEKMDERALITASTDIGLQAPRLEGVGVALARRVLETAGGSLRIEPDQSGGRIAIHGVLPVDPEPAAAVATIVQTSAELARRA